MQVILSYCPSLSPWVRKPHLSSPLSSLLLSFLMFFSLLSPSSLPSHICYLRTPCPSICPFRSMILSNLDYGCQLCSSAISPRLRILDSIVLLATVPCGRGTFPGSSFLVCGNTAFLPKPIASDHSFLLHYRALQNTTCTTLSDTSHDHVLFSSHHKCYNFRAETLLDQLSLSWPAFAATRIPFLSPLELPAVHFSRPPPASKANIPKHVSERHESCIP